MYINETNLIFISLFIKLLTKTRLKDRDVYLFLNMGIRLNWKLLQIDFEAVIKNILFDLPTRCC